MNDEQIFGIILSGLIAILCMTAGIGGILILRKMLIDALLWANENPEMAMGVAMTLSILSIIGLWMVTTKIVYNIMDW